MEGRICRWFLLFQKFSFEVIINPGKLNVGTDHLSRLELGESCGDVDEQITYACIFKVEAIPNYLSDIALFFSMSVFPEG